MTKDELLKLADRCEREEASWRLTCEIEAALHPGAQILSSTAYGTPYMRIEKGLGHKEWRPPPYTTSLDAAVTLLPERAEWDLTTLYGVARVAVGLNIDEGPHYATHEGGILPMAICAAALRARAADMLARAEDGARMGGKPVSGQAILDDSTCNEGLHVRGTHHDQG